MYELLSYPPGMSSALGELVESLAHELDQRVYVHEGVDQRERGYPHHLLASHIHLRGRGGGGGGTLQWNGRNKVRCVSVHVQ